MDLPATVRLNNHFQSLRHLKSISYLEEDHGPTVEKRWTITVNIDGEPMGSSSAPLKRDAKNSAAKQALMRLGLE